MYESLAIPSGFNIEFLWRCAAEADTTGDKTADSRAGASTISYDVRARLIGFLLQMKLAMIPRILQLPLSEDIKVGHGTLVGKARPLERIAIEQRHVDDDEVARDPADRLDQMCARPLGVKPDRVRCRPVSARASGCALDPD